MLLNLDFFKNKILLNKENYNNLIEEKLITEAYTYFKEFAKYNYDMMLFSIKNKRDIYQNYYTVKYPPVLDIYYNFSHYKDGYVYYDISKIISSDTLVYEGIFEVDNIKIQNILNDVDEFLVEVDLECEDLEATEYVNLIAFLSKNYPELIDDKLNINNIIKKIFTILNSNKYGKKDSLFIFARVFDIASDAFDFLIYDNDDESYEKVIAFFKDLKNVTYSNVEMKIKEINKNIINSINTLSYSEILTSLRFENKLYLKIPIEYLGFDKKSFNYNNKKHLFNNKDYCENLKNSPEDMYKKVILDKNNNKEMIYIYENPYLKIEFRD